MFNKVAQCRYGQMIYNINDEYVGRSFDVYGEFSEEEIELFAQVIKPTDMVLDVGANIGAHTVWFAQNCEQVIAIEPQQMPYYTLCGNVAINSLDNVQCNMVALSDKQGWADIPLLDPRQSFNFGGVEIGNVSDGFPHVKVPMITVDMFKLERCDFIKIDVEGMEEQVLRGATNTIAKYAPILYVENDRAEKSESLIKYIESLGYEHEIHLPSLFNPANYRGNPSNIFDSTASFNLICWKGEKPEYVT